MAEISLSDARDRLGDLVQEVERGGEVVITRDSRPVAKLVAVGSNAGDRSTIEKLRTLREEIAATGERFPWADVKELRDEGRR